MRTWAPRKAGDLESILTVCACANDPIHVTAQGKSIRAYCACVHSYGCEGPGKHLTIFGRSRAQNDDVFNANFFRLQILRSDWSI